VGYLMMTVAEFLETEWNIPRDAQPPNHYQLLGITAFESDLRVISEAAQRRSTRLNEFQLDPDFVPVLKALNRDIAKAKICLLSQQKKTAYDSQLPGAPPAADNAAVNGSTPNGKAVERPVNGSAPAAKKLDANPASAASLSSDASLLPQPAPFNWQAKQPANQTQAAPPSGSPQKSNQPAATGARKYAPQLRPAAPWLYVMDDSQSYASSEVIRLKKDCYVIGRSTGDIQVAHDQLISPVHVCLERIETVQPATEPQPGKPSFVWRIKDLNSDTGTFLNIFDATLRHGDHLLWGACRAKIRIDAETHELRLTVAPPFSARQVLTLQPGVHNLGRDADLCPLLSLPDDMMLEPRHAQFAYNMEKNTWSIHAYRSLNGIWLRLRNTHEIRDRRLTFQAGEQRFTFSTSPLSDRPGAP